MHKSAPADHPIHHLIAARWSPRAFAPTPVTREQTAALLEAARWAPSCFNEQPWRFIVGLADAGPTHARICDTLVDANRAWAASAPLLLLTVACEQFAHNGKPNRHAGHDLGLAMAGLTLQATSMGLSVHQMAGFKEDVARDLFALPEGHRAMTVAAVGYAGAADTLPEALREKEAAPRMRKPQSAFAFGDTWGTPW